MSKQIRTLIIAGVAIVVLVGLLLGLLFLLPADEGDSSSTTSSTTITLLDKSVDDAGESISDPVSKVVLRQGETSYTVAPDEEGQMMVEGFDDLPVDTSAVSAMTEAFALITANQKVADTSENEADFGLDEPQATAEITYADGTTATAELGDETPLKDGYYFRLSTEEAIYIVSTTFGSRLLDKAEAYVGTTLITAPAAREDDENAQAVVYGMELGGTVRGSKPFSFRAFEEESDPSNLAFFGYIITSPEVFGVSMNQEMSEMYAGVTSLYATEAEKAHPTEEDLKEYGLDNPYSTCVLTLAIQSASTNEDEETTTVYYNKTEHTIRLGNTNDDGYYYAMVDDYNAVYLISTSSVPWAEAQYTEMVSEFLFMDNIVDVSSITVSANGEETTFNLEHFPDETDNDKKMTVTVDGETYSTEEFRSLYQVFMQVSRYGETDVAPTGEPDVVFTMRLLDEDRAPYVARFYKQSANLYICAIEGMSPYTVRASDVENLLSQIETYLNGGEVVV